MEKPTIAEQIFHVSTPDTWATHVEVLATTSVFEVPVYYCTQDSQGAGVQVECSKTYYQFDEVQFEISGAT